MSMSKKDFIALADHLRHFNEDWDGSRNEFNNIQIELLAEFCASQNPRFNRSRWLAYIAGECGPNGGNVK